MSAKRSISVVRPGHLRSLKPSASQASAERRLMGRKLPLLGAALVAASDPTLVVRRTLRKRRFCRPRFEHNMMTLLAVRRPIAHARVVDSTQMVEALLVMRRLDAWINAMPARVWQPTRTNSVGCALRPRRPPADPRASRGARLYRRAGCARHCGAHRNGVPRDRSTVPAGEYQYSHASR